MIGEWSRQQVVAAVIAGVYAAATTACLIYDTSITKVLGAGLAVFGLWLHLPTAAGIIAADETTSETPKGGQ